jgi:hypothetical protein
VRLKPPTQGIHISPRGSAGQSCEPGLDYGYITHIPMGSWLRLPGGGVRLVRIGGLGRHSSSRFTTEGRGGVERP